jgi:hypothetical protein
MSEPLWSDNFVRKAFGRCDTSDKAIGAAMDMQREYERRIAELEAQLAAAQEWTPVAGGEWPCECVSCQGEDEDSWHWNFYVSGNRIGIVSRDNEDDFREVVLPPHLRLCERRTTAQAQPESEKHHAAAGKREGE